MSDEWSAFDPRVCQTSSICIFREAALLDCEESLKQEEKKRSDITSSQKPKRDHKDILAIPILQNKFST